MTEAERKARSREIIERLRNRKRYTHLDREIIAGIADADLVLAIEDLLQDHVLVGGAAAAIPSADERRKSLTRARASA